MEDQEKKKSWTERFFPPGAPIRAEAAISYILLVVMILAGCLQFFLRVKDAKEKIQWIDQILKTEGKNARLESYELARADLNYYVYGCLFIFVILVIWSLTLVFTHYASFYRNSRSIYVMKRVKSRWELHRRCLAFPFFTVVLGAVTAAGMLVVFYCFFRELPIEGKTYTIDLLRLFF